MFPIGRTTSRKEMRERQRVASERRQFPRVPASPIPPAYRRGIAMERNQPLTPPCTQPPSPQQRHVQYKILSFSDIHNTPFRHNSPWQITYDNIMKCNICLNKESDTVSSVTTLCNILKSTVPQAPSYKSILYSQAPVSIDLSLYHTAKRMFLTARTYLTLYHMLYYNLPIKS